MNIDPSRYYTAEQHKYLTQRQHAIGFERTRQILGEWEEARKQIQTAFNQGVDPTDAKLMLLAKQLLHNKRELLGEDAGINEAFERAKKMGIEDTAAVDPKESELMKYVFASMDVADSL